MTSKVVKLFLRIAIGVGFLSAVADRLGWWGDSVSVWGSWSNFLDYTQLINPWVPVAAIPALGAIATAAEIVLGICLIIGLRTEWVARLSGMLLLLFALSMTFSTGLKGALDFSVFTASAAAFALSFMPGKYWELDSMLSGKGVKNTP